MTDSSSFSNTNQYLCTDPSFRDPNYNRKKSKKSGVEDIYGDSSIRNLRSNRKVPMNAEDEKIVFDTSKFDSSKVKLVNGINLRQRNSRINTKSIK